MDIQTHQGEVLDSGESYTVIDCISCGYKHITPLPKVEESESLYRDKHYDDGERDRINYYERDREWWLINYGDVLNEIASYVEPGKNKTLVDVGCGAGIFLETANIQGWNSLGVEISEVAAQHCMEKGLNVLNESFSEQISSLPKDIQVIHMRNVLEHVPDPGALISLAYDKLEKGGLLAVAIPNDFNPIQKGLREANGTRPWWVAVPHHLNYFDFKSLERLVVSKGFSLSGRFTSFPIDLFLTMGDDYVEKPELGRAAHLRRVAFETFMQRAGLETLRRDMYRAFADLDIGREAFIFATKQ